MITSAIKARIRKLAEENGLNPENYSDWLIETRYKCALKRGESEDELLAEIFEEIKRLSKTRTREKEQDSFGKSICPSCGKMTLVHEGGCEACKECGYSRCG